MTFHFLLKSSLVPIKFNLSFCNHTLWVSNNANLNGEGGGIEFALLKGVCETRSQSIILTCNVLQEKAKHFADVCVLTDRYENQGVSSYCVVMNW